MNVSTRHVFDTLRLVCASDRPVGLAEVSAITELPTSTVHRALITLEETAYISRYHGLTKYVIGPMPQHLTHALFQRFPLRGAVHKDLAALARRTRQTVSLTMRLGWYGLKVSLVEGTQGVYHVSELGRMVLMHEDAAGQCMLATLGDDDVGQYHGFLEKHWPGGGRNLVRFDVWDAIATARREGVLLKPLPTLPGWSSLHVAVRGPDGRPVAAVSLGGPAVETGTPAGSATVDCGRAFARAVEERLAAEPRLARGPFDHLPLDAIVIGAPGQVRRSDPAARKAPETIRSD